MEKVLFVCTANVCRSPMAQAIFNTLSEDEALPFRVESAGTAALEGEPMAPNTFAVLEEAGIYLGLHRAAGERDDDGGGRAGACHGPAATITRQVAHSNSSRSVATRPFFLVAPMRAMARHMVERLIESPVMTSMYSQRA